MKKITNFSTNEKLDNNSLLALKGGGSSDNSNNGTSGIINGGDETDKRPKKPTMGETFGKNVYRA